MKRIILLELCLLFLATTFQGDRQTGWIQQQIPRPDLAVRDLQFLDTLTGFMVSTKSPTDTSFIFKTTDGGNSWITTYFDSLYLVCMDFVDESIGYCGGAKVGSGIIKKTTNGGIDWFTVSGIPYQIIEDIEFTNKDTGWVSSTNSFDGGLWRTINGGLNWQMQLNASNRPSKIFFINSDTGWVIGSADYNLYKTTNSGQNWILQSHFMILKDVYFASKDTGYLIGGSGNGMMRTTDGGNSWFNVNNPPLPVETKLHFLDNELGWAGSVFNRIYSSKDGYNWGHQYSPLFTSYYISFVDSLHGWAGASGLVHTTDGGGTIVNVVNNGSETPRGFELEQNYPNPFNSSTVIRYQLSVDSKVSIKVYDVQGREVQTLLEKRLNPGEYSVSFNGNNLPSGIYFYTLTIDGKTVAAKKMSLIK